MAQVQVQQITRISPCKITNGDYAYEEEIIVGADALRYRNGKKKNSCVMGLETQAGTDNQVVIGQYNAISTDALFVIGSGTSTSSKKNIVEVKNNKVIINGQLETSNDIIAKTNLSVTNQITAKDLTINNTATIKGKLTVPSLSVGTNFIVPSSGTITVNSSTIFGAPVNFRLSVTVDSDTTLTVDNLRNTSGKDYVTVDYAYPKGETDSKIKNITDIINTNYTNLYNFITAVKQDSAEYAQAVAANVDHTSLKRDNQLKTYIKDLQDAVTRLGKQHNITFGFIMRDWVA